jgi:hypothetical protein
MFKQAVCIVTTMLKLTDLLLNETMPTPVLIVMDETKECAYFLFGS